MRLHIFKVLCLILTPLIATSCLDGDLMNTPEDATSAIVQMSFNPDGGTTVNSGLRYFANGALLYPPTDEVDTATYAVTIQGTVTKDVTVTIATPEDALDDYLYGDKINYQMMPDSVYDFVNTTAVIKAGQNYAEFKIAFYPNKIDFTKDLMLPVTATNDASLTTSSNFGFVYFHVVGNPYAGSYKSTYTLQRPGVADVVQVENPKILIAKDKQILSQQAGKAVFNNSTITFLFHVNEDNSVTIESDPDTDIKITPTSTPSTYDPATKTFHLYYEYLNASGLYRRFSETLVKN